MCVHHEIANAQFFGCQQIFMTSPRYYHNCNALSKQFKPWREAEIVRMIAKCLATTRNSIVLPLESLSFSSKVLFTRNTYDAIPKVQEESTYFPVAPAETSKNQMKVKKGNFQVLWLTTSHLYPTNNVIKLIGHLFCVNKTVSEFRSCF